MTEAETRTFGCSEAVTSKAVRTRLLSATIACFLLASGCASDGQVLRAPSADQTTTTRPAPVTTPPDILEAESGLKISSPDFEPGDPAPKDLTCDGKNVFPTLEWEGALPANSKELAITLTDQTNPEDPLLLWLVAGISTSITQVNADLVPDNAVETLNDYGQSGFGEPCIETDSEAKDLQFRLHVLSAESGIKADAPGNEAFDQVKSLSIDSTAILVKLESGVALAAGTD